ncbi:MAG: 4Fe-4S binding protein [Oscillospiraceae bacterium]|nr:4Fe-4S binding protein [Oscillospiraceae bacterium]
MKITVDMQKCPQNHRCPAMDVCPTGAISQQDIHSLPKVDNTKCVLCEACIGFCPMGALEKS